MNIKCALNSPFLPVIGIEHSIELNGVSEALIFLAWASDSLWPLDLWNENVVKEKRASPTVKLSL